MFLLADKAKLELVGREISGRPVPGKARWPFGRWLLSLPALACVAIILVPTAVTALAALDSGSAGFRKAFDDRGLSAFVGSLLWILLAAALVVLGFGVALVGYRIKWMWWVLQPALVIPFAASSFVAGAAFRILFDPSPERGTMTRIATVLFDGSPVWLGPGWIRFVLISAFAWTWLGFVVALFRKGLESIPIDIRRAARADGLQGLRLLWTVEIRILRPIIGILGLTLLVAAVRLFDLVLVVAPPPMQTDVDVLALHWGRLSNAAPEAGPPAIVALTLFAIVAVFTVIGSFGLRRRWTMPASLLENPVPETRLPALGLLTGLVLAVLWVFPLFVLIVTALHNPRAAGLGGWWSPNPCYPRTGDCGTSFGAAFNEELRGALVGTGAIAISAAILVLAIATPTAWMLAWGGRPRFSRFITTGFILLAVVPVQVYAPPLRTWLDDHGLAGSRSALLIVHVAAGLPFAVLLLRAAFASVPGSVATEALVGPSRRTTLVNRVREACWPAFIAVGVLEFVLVWNDFIVGFLITGPGSTPLTLLLWGEGRLFETAAGPIAAGALLSVALPAVVLLATWRWVVKGLTVGTGL